MKNEQDRLNQDFVTEASGQFAAVETEIAERNASIQENDQFIYGNLLERKLNIPIGHDFTPINWLRRVVEIHRSQFMGKGFSIDSSYTAIDIGQADSLQSDNPDAQKQLEAERQRLIVENEKRKAFAAARRQMCEQINRDNGGDAFWATSAENASAVGDTVIKGWYDETKKKYILQQVETVDNFYVLWNADDFRQFDAVAFIYQVSLDKAMSLYGVPADVQMSPLGSPLSVLNMEDPNAVSSQPMVTIMEITGKIEGWKSNKGTLSRCTVGKETPLNAICVGNTVYQVVDEVKYMPHYYILPNKRQRRRPWGVSDISKAAAQINLTYIETLSDWRTVANKVNFPKFKAFGFPAGIQPPKPKPRTSELLPLADGQDIQPLNPGQSAEDIDFIKQLNELESQFIREVGISRQLFDMPDGPSNSNPATLTSMKSISDITDNKRKLWEPIIRDIFEDALRTVAEFNDDIKDIVSDDDWHIKVSFPSSLSQDDPSYHSMKLNQFNMGLLSAQTFLEDTGYDKQELDRIKEEMEDPITASIHGHILGELANMKIAPPGQPQPKVNISLRGDLSPEQEGNLAYQQGFNNGPFGPSTTAQGNQGLYAQANADNQDYLQGGKPNTETAISRGPDGKPMGGSPEMINGANTNQPGVGMMSMPGSGAPMTSPGGKLKQKAQRKGA